MSSEHTSLSSLKEQRANGDISREEYWSAVQNSAHQLSELTEVFSSEVNYLIADSKGLKISVKSGRVPEIQLQLNPEDIRSAPMTILTEGDYEGFQAQLIQDLALQTNVMLDIGANVGFYTTGCALASTKLSVHAFEPNTKVFQILTNNVEMNEVSNQVTLHNFGLSDTNSVQTLFIPKFTGSGGGSIMNLHPEEGEAETLSIELKKLEDVPIGPFELMKIDVEGHELSAIQGALQAISKYKPTIVIELLRKWMVAFGTHPQNVLDLLTAQGYECFAIESNGLTRIKKIDDHTIANNFVFCHSSRANHMQLIEQFL